MRFYIAARFSRRPEANALAHQLKTLGHTITSRWVKPDSDHVLPTGLSQQAADHERERFAREDLEDVESCDAMVSLMEEPRTNGRGGRHVEFGIALGMGKRLYIIGPRETVFHHLTQVRHFDSAREFIAYLEPKAPSRVPDLQRELLAIARGGKFYDSWAKVNGTETTPNLRRELSTLAQINHLRDQIRAINPNAALYYGWGGHGDRARESKRWNG